MNLFIPKSSCFNFAYLVILYRVPMIIGLFTDCAYKEQFHMIHDSTLYPDTYQPTVAVITAGALRSFAYTGRSWNRYMLSKWRKSTYVFASAIGSRHCPLSHHSANLLRKLAAKLEISWSDSPINSLKTVNDKLPIKYRAVDGLKSSSSSAHGNVIDMWARRSRAYNLAKGYANQFNISWDLVVFVRLDSAFYSPVLDFPQWYISLKQREDTCNTSIILIPRSCNFSGVCDRFAAGLPQTMDTYFQEDWVFATLLWSTSSRPDLEESTVSFRLKNELLLDAGTGSELLLKAWLFMNGITSVYPELQVHSPVSFVTLRSLAANTYCASSRAHFLYDDDSLSWTDKVMAYTEESNDLSAFTGFDLIASAVDRCGSTHTLNATELCRHEGCFCGSFG